MQLHSFWQYIIYILFLGFIETDVHNESSVIFTNSARGAEELQKSMMSYSIVSHLLTEFMTEPERKDAMRGWKSGVESKRMNVLG